MAGACWAALYWLLGAFLGGLPIILEATGNFDGLGLDTVAKIHSSHYKDLAVYTLVIAGIGLGDAFEASRLNTSPHNSFIAVPIWVTFAILLVLVFILAASFGQVLAGSKSAYLPLGVFQVCIVIAFLAKVIAEGQRALEASRARLADVDR